MAGLVCASAACSLRVLIICRMGSAGWRDRKPRRGHVHPRHGSPSGALSTRPRMTARLATPRSSTRPQPWTATNWIAEPRQSGLRHARPGRERPGYGTRPSWARMAGSSTPPGRTALLSTLRSSMRRHLGQLQLGETRRPFASRRGFRGKHRDADAGTSQGGMPVATLPAAGGTSSTGGTGERRGTAVAVRAAVEPADRRNRGTRGATGGTGGSTTTAACSGVLRAGICWYLGHKDLAASRPAQATVNRRRVRPVTWVQATQGGSLAECGVILGLLASPAHLLQVSDWTGSVVSCVQTVASIGSAYQLQCHGKHRKREPGLRLHQVSGANLRRPRYATP